MIVDREGKRDRWVQVAVLASKQKRCEDAAENSKGPAGGHDHPAAVLRFAALQQNACNDTVAEQYQHKSAHELAQHRRTHLCSPQLFLVSGALPAALGASVYCAARSLKRTISASTHAWSLPSSRASRPATVGAIAMAARAFRNSARVRRARTSSTQRAISSRAAQTTSAAI